MMKCKQHFVTLIIPVLFVSCHANVLDNEPENKPENIKGFGYPITEDVEGGKITYQYNDEVIVLSETTQRYLVKVEADTILYFSEATPERLLPYKGGIISSAVIDDKTPYGLGNRVISVSQESGLYKCVTTAASLDEIFKELTLAADIMLVTDAIPSQVEDVDGNLHDVTVSKFSETKAEIGSPNVLTVKLEGQSDEQVGPYVEGDISLGAVLSIDFERSKNRYDCSLSLYAGFDGEIGVKTQCEGYKKLLPRKDKWQILDSKLPFGPVVLRPFVNAEIGLKGNAEGSISTGLFKEFGAKFGMKNRKSFYENLTEPDAKIIKDISVDVKGEVALVTTLYFGMGLYTKNIAVSIDPSLSVGLSTDFKVNNENLFKNNPTLDFDIKAETKGAFYAQFFGKELFREEMDFVSLNLFNHSWPLLPSLVENSLKVTKRDASGPLTFDAEYSLAGGLLSNLDYPLYPAFKVYKGSELVDFISSAENIYGDAAKEFTFELSGLENEVSYTGKPCLVIGDKSYDEDGIAFASSLTCPDSHHPHLIDLGLPSGTMWACCNVGANAPKEFGGKYAWGETETKDVYNIKTYKFAKEVNPNSYDGHYWIWMDYRYIYVYIGNNISGTDYDVAHVRWGKPWRMPTSTESQEICDNCTWVEYTLNGTAGYKVIGPNDNYIFMPKAVTNDNYWAANLQSEWSDLHMSPFALIPSSTPYVFKDYHSESSWVSLSPGAGFYIRPIVR